MSIRKFTLVLTIVMVFAMLVAVVPVWAEDPVGTGSHSSSRASLADAARWRGLAESYLSSAPYSLPVTGIDRGRKADAARWNALAGSHIAAAPSSLPVTGIDRGRKADILRWNSLAALFISGR
jgi:hypothetical protein